ncbi:MAG: hypothetical protein ACJAUP_001811 [Cellvibrionaceae bacterium]|jgi:hypothetical protein
MYSSVNLPVLLLSSVNLPVLLLSPLTFSTFADQLSLDSDEFAVSGTKLAQAANLE